MMKLSQYLNRLWPSWHDWVLLTRFDKPVGSYLLLWPTLWGLWAAAEGVPHLDNLLIFSVGVLLMRSAGCVINDYADRHIDKHVKRTANRPLTQGRISEKAALTGFVILSVSAFMLVLFTNLLTIGMSVIGALLAIVYPFMKRHTHMPQVFLGAAFSWSVPMAFTAEANQLTSVAWLLFIANLAWTVGYDSIYAMVDRDDDLKIGVKSTAILFGEQDLLMISVLYGCAHLCLLMAASQLDLQLVFYVTWLLGGLFLAWQIYSIRSRERDICFLAFRRSHFYGLIILAGFILGTL